MNAAEAEYQLLTLIERLNCGEPGALEGAAAMRTGDDRPVTVYRVE